MISAIILNWERPDNVLKIVDGWQRDELVCEAIVFNNNPRKSLVDHQWATVINASSDLGLFTRFAAACLAKNDCVLIQDDDLELPSDSLGRLFRAWQRDPEVLHGVFGRAPKPDGSYARDLKGNHPAPIVLTRVLLSHRRYAAEFFRALPEFTTCMRDAKPPGNGEDILFSYVARRASGRLNQIHKVRVNELPAPHAIHARYRQHVEHRTRLMQACEEWLVRESAVKSTVAEPAYIPTARAETPEDKVFIKQYGQYRTGTNWLKVLLEKNFLCRVLPYALGHKHNVPCDWRRWLDHNTHEDAKALMRAVEADRLRVIVSSKDPYGACHSFIRFRKFNWRSPRDSLEALIGNHCLACNVTYRAWIDLIESINHRRGTIVRYESLISDVAGTLKEVTACLDLTSRESPADVAVRVESGERATSKPHDREFWIGRRYLDVMPRWAIDLVSDSIDWHVFQRLGYRPYDGKRRAIVV